ncbi:MAG TPA: glycoside hydrolase family 2 TIM barrel-domain containing protein [Vicinamibacteria bacterium]|nr:glycoside hydrolase family 2 TIM barrel-domain containing protein [Vicinamibacteria bacterium]
MSRRRRACAVVLLCAVAGLAAAPPAAVPRPEHPRPDRVRADWLSLNGPWSFEFDDADRGRAERWHTGTRAFSRTIVVPYAFQSRLSGIGETGFHDVVWYRRAVEVPEAWRGRRVMLRFGAVDYEATVWVNGMEAGRHRGGHTPFSFDVTDSLGPGSNVIVVRVSDPGTDRTIPRGKQYWKEKPESIFYTRTTGLWQPVWLEPVHPLHVVDFRVTPDVDRSEVRVEGVLSRPAPGLRWRVTARFDGQLAAQAETAATDTRPAAVLELRGQRLWRPERPNLYDLTLELLDGGQVVDRVESYFGQRKVAVHGDRVYLNNAPYYLRLVLDQGYWPESTLTPPSEEAIKRDIELTKALGFNGARKHQKVEDPRWLYWADRMGLLVWGEMANAYEYSEEYVDRFVAEWQEVVARDYNRPSVVAWVPINESWGVDEVLTDPRQQSHLKALYHLTRSLDATRPVVDNDGWEHVDTTDLFTLHDYARTGAELAAKYDHLRRDRSHIPRNGREALAFGYRYNGTPILMTEFGGIAFRIDRPAAEGEWGYSGIEPTREAFLARLDGLVKAIRGNPVFSGFCYTQLTDVEQEINGLLTYDRRPKADLAELAKIIGQD